jgi:hypothetical protein
MVLGAFNSLRILMTWSKLPLFPFNGSFVIFPKIHKNLRFQFVGKTNSIEQKDNGEFCLFASNVCIYGSEGREDNNRRKTMETNKRIMARMKITHKV